MTPPAAGVCCRLVGCRASSAVHGSPRSLLGSHSSNEQKDTLGEVFCGIVWAERHHDVAIVDDQGRSSAERRMSDDLNGVGDLTALLAEHSGSNTFDPLDIAIETDRSLLVAAPRAAGHRVFAVNPEAVGRYRDRRGVCPISRSCSGSPK